jgi:hypothetical protein
VLLCRAGQPPWHFFFSRLLINGMRNLQCKEKYHAPNIMLSPLLVLDPTWQPDGDTLIAIIFGSLNVSLAVFQICISWRLASGMHPAADKRVGFFAHQRIRTTLISYSYDAAAVLVASDLPTDSWDMFWSENRQGSDEWRMVTKDVDVRIMQCTSCLACARLSISRSSHR